MTELNELGLSFDFTDTDLEANRKGYLTPSQQKKCRLELVKARTSMLGRSLTAVEFLVTFVLFIRFNLQYGNTIGPLVLVGIVIWLAFFALLSKITDKAVALLQKRYEFDEPQWISRLAARTDPEHWQAIETGRVQRSNGKFRLQSDGEHLHLFIGEIELTQLAANPNDMRLWKLQPDTRYTIYYVFDPQWIVAIEPV